MKRPRSIVATIGTCLATLGLVMGALVTTTPSAGAQTGFQRGPNPNALTLRSRGPFATSQVNASGGLGGGFNNVTICYPNDTSQGTFAGVVVSPGFMSPKALMMWSCQKIASHGFVVAVMEPNSILDFPAQRADQVQAILRFLRGSSAPSQVRQRLDVNRLGAMGHSMGGGAALQVGTRDNPEVNAVVALQPFDILASYALSDTPSMVIGASNDVIASPGLNAEPFYNSILLAEKQYVELSGQGHLVGISDNAQQSAAAIAWFKRFLDNDTRYTQFLCPPVSGLGIAETRSTCPY